MSASDAIEHWDRASLHAKARAIERLGADLCPEDTKEIIREIKRTRRRWRRRNNRRWMGGGKGEKPLRAFPAGNAGVRGRSKWRVSTSRLGDVVVVIDDTDEFIVTVLRDARFNLNLRRQGWPDI